MVERHFFPVLDLPEAHGCWDKCFCSSRLGPAPVANLDLLSAHVPNGVYAAYLPLGSLFSAADERRRSNRCSLRS